MNVNIINKDELKDLFRIWGETSAICYNTDKKYAVGVGKSCLKTKHFSGSRSRYIVFEFEGISRACYDGDTDILTKDGWKKFKDLANDEVVATLNRETGKVEYHTINEKIEYDYTGTMHRIKNTAVDLNITANHNILFKKQDAVYKTNNHTTHLMPIEEVKTGKIMMDKRFIIDNNVCDTVTIKGYIYSKKTNNGRHCEMYTGDLVLNRAEYYKLLAWYLSDGSTYYDEKEGKYVIKICQTKSQSNIENKTIEQITEIINRLGFTPNYDRNGVRFNSRTLGRFFKELGTSGDKFIPHVVSEEFSKGYAQIFLNEYFKGDGHIDKNGVGFLYTGSERLADQLQELCFVAGWTGLKRERNKELIGTKQIVCGREVTINLPSFIINVSFNVRNSQPCVNLKKNMTIEDVVNKPVFCVNVTNNIIFVRRNGVAVWCGNCADQMLRHSIGTSPNMQSGRYVSLEDFNYYIPKPILKNERALKVYEKHMLQTQINYKLICEALEEDGLQGESVYECARGISPMNYYTKVTMGFTIEALINFMNKRLCVCSQDEIREVAREMKIQTLAFIPELTDYLVPICQSQLWCPEAPKRSCGAYMQKDELLKLIKDNKTNINE